MDVNLKIQKEMVRVRDIEAGDCFIWEEEAYMVNDHSDSTIVTCSSLEDGELMDMECYLMVEPATFKIMRVG